MGLGCDAVIVQASLRRILVVDDDRDIRVLLGRLLADAFEVETSIGGVHGLARCLATSFDAVVTDVRMPDLDGVSMVQALREANLCMPVVFFTGSPGDVSPGSLEVLQPACLVAKPCAIERLRAALVRLGL
jgi:DNA-binding NtrC family response regulator